MFEPPHKRAAILVCDLPIYVLRIYSPMRPVPVGTSLGTRCVQRYGTGGDVVTMYCHIGQRIREDVVGNERTEHGKQILATLSQQFTQEFERGFRTGNLHPLSRRR